MYMYTERETDRKNIYVYHSLFELRLQTPISERNRQSEKRVEHAFLYVNSCVNEA